MCRDPVTLGGGITMLKRGLSDEGSARNAPIDSQNAYHFGFDVRVSNPFGNEMVTLGSYWGIPAGRRILEILQAARSPRGPALGGAGHGLGHLAADLAVGHPVDHEPDEPLDQLVGDRRGGTSTASGADAAAGPAASAWRMLLKTSATATGREPTGRGRQAQRAWPGRLGDAGRRGCRHRPRRRGGRPTSRRCREAGERLIEAVRSSRRGTRRPRASARAANRAGRACRARPPPGPARGWNGVGSRRPRRQIGQGRRLRSPGFLGSSSLTRLMSSCGSNGLAAPVGTARPSRASRPPARRRRSAGAPGCVPARAAP